MKRTAGFTLIELLIVVAIISILAAVAVPNFLEAQTRSKVARVRADHRTMAMAIEAYAVDRNAYPSANSEGSLKWLRWITTPVAYMERVDLLDPFTEDKSETGGGPVTRNYRYYGWNEKGYLNADTDSGTIIEVYKIDPGELRIKFFTLFSHGPDRIRSKASNGQTFVAQDTFTSAKYFSEILYDPTNGTTSNGELLRVGGAPLGRAANAMAQIQRTQ